MSIKARASAAMCSSAATTAATSSPTKRSVVSKSFERPAYQGMSGAFLWVSTSLTPGSASALRSEEHTSELQSQFHLVCRLLLVKLKFEKGCGVDKKDEGIIPHYFCR